MYNDFRYGLLLVTQAKPKYMHNKPTTTVLFFGTIEVIY